MKFTWYTLDNLGMFFIIEKTVRQGEAEDGKKVRVRIEESSMSPQLHMRSMYSQVLVSQRMRVVMMLPKELNSFSSSDWNRSFL